MVVYWVFYMLYEIFLTNCSNLLLVNAVPGSVRLFLGMPLSAMYRSRKFITSFVVGVHMNFASSQPILPLFDTIKYFSEHRAILNGPAKSMAISTFVFFLVLVLFQNVFDLTLVLMTYLRSCIRGMFW